MTREGIDDPERDVGAGIGLHVHGDPPWLPAVLENSNLQMRSRLVVFPFVPVGPASEHTIHNRNASSFEPSRTIMSQSRRQAGNFRLVRSSLSIYARLTRRVPEGKGEDEIQSGDRVTL